MLAVAAVLNVVHVDWAEWCTGLIGSVDAFEASWAAVEVGLAGLGPGFQSLHWKCGLLGGSVQELAPMICYYSRNKF